MFWNKKLTLRQKLEASWGRAKDEAFKFDLIEHYFRRREKASAFQVISDRTMHDIDFRSLFTFTDRTNSRIGQQCLFDKLVTIRSSPDFEEQEGLIAHFTADSEKRVATQSILTKLNHENAFHISRLFLEEFTAPPNYLFVVKLLSVISITTFAAAFFIPKLFIILLVLFCINLVLHYVNKNHIYVYSDSIPQLSLLCNATKSLLKLGLPLGSTAAVSSSLRSVEHLRSRMVVFTLEAKSLDPIAGFFYVLVEYLKIQFLLEPIIVFNVLKRLREKRAEIRCLYEFFGKVDCAMSMASLRHGLACSCQPTLRHGEALSFSGIYHPLVPDCVPNAMTVGEKSILLTGSNMSGKTTFIRAVLINALFAQTINTCFASAFRLAPMRIFSAIRISDDVVSGKSHYFEEVVTINEMVRESQSGVRTLFLLDEIFKGTNTIERIAAGKAVLSHICRNGNCVFVSTHDIELTALLSDSYDLYHFTEIVENGAVHFDYSLKNGELTRRNAIRILEINGYPPELVAGAKAISHRILSGEQRGV